MQSPERSPHEILRDIWTSVGGEAAALDALTLTGDEPQLPSSFRVAAAAQVSATVAEHHGVSSLQAKIHSVLPLLGPRAL